MGTIKLLSMDTNFMNPEDLAKVVMSQSFLKGRGDLRQTGSGSNFFHDNRIRSCSFVKECKGGLKAVPYYEKRMSQSSATNPDMRRSWASTVHSNRGSEHAGGSTNKTLGVYNPNAPRNLMAISDFKPPYPNSSRIEFGVRTKRDPKHYKTTYQNDLIRQARRPATSHPGIQAFKNKWLRSRLQK